MSAKPRSLLKLDQAYIAVGGREHFTLERETDIMCTIALRISPRDAEVPSSTQSAYKMHRCRVAHNLPRLSPVGTNRDAHRIGSRFPLGPRSPSSITPDMYPDGMPNIPNGRETSPRIPFPPGQADGSADCLSLHTLVHGRLTVGVKRHSLSQGPPLAHTHSLHQDSSLQTA